MNVVSFETFFDHYLDPAIVRWKANGTISCSCVARWR